MKKIIYFLSCLSLIWANIEDYRVGTWNLQGASARTENKWNISVRQLITGENPVDVLMVQEAGALPSSARRTRRMIQPGGTPIEEYIWDLGTRTRPRSVYIYYSDLDVGARRVNLAIVSTRQADEAYVVHQDTIAGNSRPAIGIRIGTDAFFNIHALANGGTDAAALVTAVSNTMQTQSQSVSNWIIAGDFNRNPASLQSGLGTVLDRARILDPRSATHAGSSGEGRTLDYAVIGTTQSQASSLPAIVAILMAASVRSYLASDHFPVRFGRF